MSASPNNPAPGSTKPGPAAPAADFPAIPGFPRSDHRDLETLLALSSLHEQIRRRRAQELNRGSRLGPNDAWELKQFVQDEVLQLVAERAIAVTGADGVAVALVDGNGIVCRASAGAIAPEKGARLDLSSGFSGACLRTGAIIRCDDSEQDNRVSPEACRRLGTRSMVAVPLSASQAIIGVLEAFSAEPLGFNDSDVRSLSLLSELILDAMKPAEEYRLAEISQQVVNTTRVTSPVSPEVIAELKLPASRNESRRVEPIRLLELEKPRDAQPEPRDETVSTKYESDASRQDAKLVLFSDFEQSKYARPGLKLVILLVMLAIALGTGLWWQIRGSHARKLASQKIVKALPVTATAPSGKELLSQASDSLPQTAETKSASTDSSQASSTGSEGTPSIPEITGIRHWSSADSSTVVIDLEDQVQYEAHRLTNPERIYFDLLDTKLAHGLFGKVIEVNDPVLQRIRIAQPKEGVTRVVLDTKGASNYSVSMEQDPDRLVVEVGKLGSKLGPSTKMNLFEPTAPVEANLNVPAPPKVNAAGAANVNGPPQFQKLKPAQPVATAPSFSIALDAGHGGWDLGTVGRKGLEEKDLVLDIVQRLGDLLERRLNAKVIYTRSDDSYVALEKRAEIANLSQANLFVSVHANYSDSTSARGVETYYTNTYSSVRARTSDVDAEPSVQNVDWTRVDIREKVLESHHLAECVQQALYGTVEAKNPGIRDRGVKEAQYVVLTGTSMPAILAEVSFVSSPADETELQSAAYRQRIAEALYKGIARYRESPHRTTMAGLLGKSAAR
ncbi:MAG: N-acetylmuramoyl-L-alanine amidase [Terriglobales bacterium]